MGQPETEPMTIDQAAGEIEKLYSLGEEDSQEQPEPTDEVTTEAEETEEVSDESDTDEEEQTESDTEDEEQASIESISDLAEALDVPIDELSAKLTHKIKVDGVESDVTLQELVSGYQKDSDYRRKTSEVAELKRNLESERAQFNQYSEAQLLQMGRFFQEAQKLFLTPPADLDQLRQTDPGEYAARVQEFNQKQQQLLAIQSQAASVYQRVQQQQKQQTEAAYYEAMKKASEELPNRIQGWSKETAKKLDEYLMGDRYGYRNDDLLQITDPRLVELAHKAMLWDEKAKATDTVVKKVKTLPKLQKSVKPEGKVSVKSSQINKAKQRFAKTHSLDDAARAIELMGIV